MKRLVASIVIAVTVFFAAGTAEAKKNHKRDPYKCALALDAADRAIAILQNRNATSSEKRQAVVDYNGRALTCRANVAP